MQLITNTTFPIYLMSTDEIIEKKKELRKKFLKEFKNHDLQFAPMEFDFVFPDSTDLKTIMGEAIVRRDSENRQKFNTQAIFINTDHFNKDSDFNKENDKLRKKHHKIDEDLKDVLKCERFYIPEEIDTFIKVKKEIKIREGLKNDRKK